MGRRKKAPKMVDGTERWRCGKCREWLPATAFGPDSCTTGLRAQCRQCKKEADKEYRDRYRSKRRRDSRRWARNNSYRKVAFQHHRPCCNRCGWAEYQGVLVVHHRDRDPDNSHPDNLEILCPTCHYVAHYLARDGIYTSRYSSAAPTDASTESASVRL